MPENISDLATLMRQIELENEAAQRGLLGLASGTARHDFITARDHRIHVMHQKDFLAVMKPFYGLRKVTIIPSTLILFVFLPSILENYILRDRIKDNLLETHWARTHQIYGNFSTKNGKPVFGTSPMSKRII